MVVVGNYGNSVYYRRAKRVRQEVQTRKSQFGGNKLKIFEKYPVLGLKKNPV